MDFSNNNKKPDYLGWLVYLNQMRKHLSGRN